MMNPHIQIGLSNNQSINQIYLPGNITKIQEKEQYTKNGESYKTAKLQNGDMTKQRIYFSVCLFGPLMFKMVSITFDIKVQFKWINY